MEEPASAGPQPTAAPQSDGGSPVRILGYEPRPDAFDEMVLPSGELRPHWRVFGQFLSQCSPGDLQARFDTVQRLLRDHGVTYNIYDDALGTSRPWELDLIPFIVAADEARLIAEGMDQRARLLDAIIADLYGGQHLIREGWIPPALVAANPAFLRPIVGISPPGGRFLHAVGCDLVRTSDGLWQVLADRVQVPSGQGYALENRIIMSNVFPEEFNASRVQRLADYFEAERETFRSLAPSRRGGATIAMFTPGPRDETYFEHAFKARYLGFPLVESADLTVRDRRVHLKTLEGLRHVDVLVRRQEDFRCDPLELGGDASAGIPGLVEAWRSGSVALANGLGTGVAGTPALHPFMAGLCRHLLGEELKIPCAPTWWCGQKRELEMVLSTPDRWVIKQAFVRGKRDPIFLGRLDAETRAAALDRIKAAPHEWVAQDTLTLSTAPTWVAGRLEPRPVVWRTFMLASGTGYSTMPGGLSRVSPHPQGWIVTMRSGGVSKDTWVLSEGHVVGRPLRDTQPVTIRPARPPSAVPSRVADHLFWLGRYAERLEESVRVVRCALQRLSGEHTAVQSSELRGCLNLMAGLGWVVADQPLAGVHRLVQDMVQNPHRAGGVWQLISALRHNAAAARDRLSDDTWRLFNRIERDACRQPAASDVASMLGTLDTLVLDLAAFSGMQVENMTHGHGWRFLEIGRRIERALFIAALVKAGALAASRDEAVLVPLLEICDSSMTYRRLHFARPKIVQTAYLLMQDAANPRSVAYQVERLTEHAAHLPGGVMRGTERAERMRTTQIRETLRTLDLPAWTGTPAKALQAIPDACAALIAQLEDLSHAITEHYFSHAVRRVR